MLQPEPPLDEFLKKCEENIPQYHEFIETVFQGLKKLSTSTAAMTPDQGHARQISKTIQVRSGRRVLIVDDAEINRVLLGHFFKGMPVRLEYSKSGEDALQKSKQLSHDLIIMDLQLTGLSGIETIKAIREFDPKSFILAITNQVPTDQEKKSALQAGCNEYIGKDRLKEALLDIVIVALKD